MKPIKLHFVWVFIIAPLAFACRTKSQHVRLMYYHLREETASPGRQYVLDDDAPVYGVWLHPDEHQEPVLIAGSA